MRDKALDVMNRADAVYLATVNGAAPRVRAMVNLRRIDRYPRPAAFCQAEGFTVYFSTSAASGKIRELRANPVASAYFALPGEFLGVEVAGTAAILDDPGLKRTLWDECWQVYWPRPEDPDYVVVRLSPTDVSGWCGSNPFRVTL